MKSRLAIPPSIFTPTPQFRNLEIREITELPHEVLAKAEWKSLFNGKDLTGWQLLPEVTGKAEATMDEGKPALRLTAPIHLPSTTRHGNYHLRFDYRAEKGMGGGIHLFGDSNGRLSCELGALDPGPRIAGINSSWQQATWKAGRLIGDGNTISGNNKTTFSVARDQQSPWQRIEIIRGDDFYVLLVNGKLAGAISNVRRKIGEKEELPGRSGLVLLAFGGNAHYRDMEIREIAALPSEVLTLTPP
jgi:hypothetical protein